MTHVYLQREGMPIELDDSLALIAHAAILEKDPQYQSEFLKSFNDLMIIKPQITWAHFHQNRVYHRIKSWYHGGHALLLYIVKKTF